MTTKQQLDCLFFSFSSDNFFYRFKTCSKFTCNYLREFYVCKYLKLDSLYMNNQIITLPWLEYLVSLHLFYRLIQEKQNGNVRISEKLIESLGDHLQFGYCPKYFLITSCSHFLFVLLDALWAGFAKKFCSIPTVFSKDYRDINQKQLKFSYRSKYHSVHSENVLYH